MSYINYLFHTYIQRFENQQDIPFLQTTHPLYSYNSTEMILMVIITAITNFTIIPTIILFYRKQRLFSFYLGLFTFIASFMYHLLDSIAFYKFILTQL